MASSAKSSVRGSAGGVNGRTMGGHTGNSIRGKSNVGAGMGRKPSSTRSTKLRGNVGVGQTMKASGPANRGPKVPVKPAGRRQGGSTSMRST